MSAPFKKVFVIYAYLITC